MKKLLKNKKVLVAAGAVLATVIAIVVVKKTNPQVLEDILEP